MPTIRTLTAEVVGDTLNLTETEESLATTPLAEVNSDSAPDTILAVKDGAVVQVPADEIGATADGIAYDNTDSGLTATDVQGAVDELAGFYSTSWTENGLTYAAHRYGRIAEILCNAGSATDAVVANGTMATIPVGYRPVSATINAWSSSTAKRIALEPDGTIKNVAAMTAGESTRFSAVYICAPTLPS